MDDFDPATTLVLTRRIAARPETVWRCWTEPDLLRQWFAPKPVETIEARVDAHPGGVFRVVMQMPGHAPMDGPSGCVLVADPGKRLVWTAALGPGFVPNPPHDDPNDFYNSVDIRLRADSAGCTYEVFVLHATPQAKVAHEEMGFFDGWGTMTDQLDALAKTL